MGALASLTDKLSCCCRYCCWQVGVFGGEVASEERKAQDKPKQSPPTFESGYSEPKTARKMTLWRMK